MVSLMTHRTVPQHNQLRNYTMNSYHDTRDQLTQLLIIILDSYQISIILPNYVLINQSYHKI